jgi:protein-disulfide isomerase
MHNWARTAAVAGRCVYKQNPAAFWDYFDWVYENQNTIGLDNFTSKFDGFTSDKKLDGMQLGRCIEGKSADADIDREKTEGHALQVAATPTLFLNGRKFEGGLDAQSFDGLIKMEIDHKAKLASADDKCCEVTLPKIVK